MSDAPEPGTEGGLSRSDWLAVLILLALACVLRFYRLGDWSFWADEIFTLRDAQNLSNVSGYPLGYALIRVAVDRLGVSEFAARLMPALAGVISVPLLYLLGRRIVSTRAAFLGATLMALSSYHIYYSQYARYYTLVVLLGMVGMWAVFAGIESNRKGGLILALVALALAFFTHWSAALLVPAAALYLAWSYRGEDRPRGLTRLNLAILIAPIVCAGIVLGGTLWKFAASWKGGVSFSLARLGLVTVKLVDRMDAAVLICALVGVGALRLRKDRRLKWLLPFAVVPVLGVIALSQGGSRFAIVSLPAVVLLAGAGMDGLIEIAGDQRRRYAWILVALVLFVVAVKDVQYFTAERGQRPRWREAITWAMADQPDADFIVTTPEILQHYTGREARRLSEFDDDALERALSGPLDRDLWIIVERTPNVRPTPAQKEIIAQHAEPVRDFPLHVRYVLDYSITVFRVAAR